MLLWVGLAWLGSGTVFAQNCSSLPPASEFTVTRIATTPGWSYDLAVAKDLKVYWVERFGDFRVWDPVSNLTTLIRHFDVLAQNGTPGIYGNVETGLQGLLLDQNFETTHWVYLWYSVPTSQLPPLTQHALGPIERLSRFTLNGANTLVNNGSEKIIFEHRVFAQCCHFGGDMKWGLNGEIFWSTGDNIHYQYTGNSTGGPSNAYTEAYIYGDPRNTSSNTNDTRGKILRILPIPFPDTQTPAPGIGTTYTIPSGNLRQYWSSPDSLKVRPEIYSMGHRNPFTIGIHPTLGWVAVGEANGDDNNYGEDEINVVTHPGYFGWPFLIGNNVAYCPPFWSGKIDPSTTPGGIVNSSTWNTGANVLPPAVPAMISTKTTSPNYASLFCFGVTWGFPAFDSTLNSRVKWPTYLAGKILFSSFGSADLRVGTLDNNGRLTRMETLFPAGHLASQNVMKAIQGPDGAFYVSHGDPGMQFGTSSVAAIYKISYNGACNPVTAVKPGNGFSRPGHLSRIVHFGATEVFFPAGIRRVRALNLAGRQVWEAVRDRGEGESTQRIPASVPPGMLQLVYLTH